jgi:hypothetical protein
MLKSASTSVTEQAKRIHEQVNALREEILAIQAETAN